MWQVVIHDVFLEVALLRMAIWAKSAARGTCVLLAIRPSVMRGDIKRRMSGLCKR